MKSYAVTLNTTCEMVVYVDASSEADAKRIARAGEYSPATEWQPLDYEKLRAVYVERRQPSEHQERG